MAQPSLTKNKAQPRRGGGKDRLPVRAAEPPRRRSVLEGSDVPTARVFSASSVERRTYHTGKTVECPNHDIVRSIGVLEDQKSREAKFLKGWPLKRLPVVMGMLERHHACRVSERDDEEAFNGPSLADVNTEQLPQIAGIKYIVCALKYIIRFL